MERAREFLYSLPRYLLSSVASVLTVAQVILAFFFFGGSTEAVKLAGWICLWVSAIFGILPIIIFRRIGGVPRGKNYTQTTKFIDTGLYAVVRHPQVATTWLLISLGIILITGHWTSAALGIPSMVLAYLDTYKLDHNLIEKFGNDYRRYIKEVPRVNVILGIIRLVYRWLK